MFGFDIYSAGFNLFTFTGLTLTYLYFQIPLMVLVMRRRIDGLKREWREAAEMLGASTLAILAHDRLAGAVAEHRSAPRCCCSPTPSAPSPPPMR